MLFTSLKKRILVSYWYYFLLNKVRRFSFCGKSLCYVTNRYHNAYLSERTAEIPAILSLLADRKGDSILEVGNVLSHYVSVSHDILDKYEVSPGVINKDIVEFIPTRLYDTVVCISTVEHIGWDENPKDTYKIYIENKAPNLVLKEINPQKILKTLALFKTMVRSGGLVIITFPAGYNPHLDKMVEDGAIVFSERYCLKRISEDNRWVECDWEEVKTKRYNSPYFFGNGLIIGIIRIE
jgi:hypothetical protein